MALQELPMKMALVLVNMHVTLRASACGTLRKISPLISSPWSFSQEKQLKYCFGALITLLLPPRTPNCPHTCPLSSSRCKKISIHTLLSAPPHTHTHNLPPTLSSFCRTYNANTGPLRSQHSIQYPQSCLPQNECREGTGMQPPLLVSPLQELWGSSHYSCR